MTTSGTSPSERPSRVHAVLNHVSIRVKLRVMAAFGAIALVLLSSFLVWRDYRTSYAGREQAIRDAVQSVSATLHWAHDLERRGVVSREQAQAMAKELVRRARYAGNEYFWINDLAPRVVMHPIKPELEGQDVGDMRDPNGTPLFRRFAEVARTQGAGYVPYLWPKPGSDAPVEKVSYVQGFEPWGWVVGSGLYIDDLRAAFYQRLGEVTAWVLGTLAATWLIMHFVYESITRGLAKASRVAKAISGGDISAEILLIGSDEIGDLIRDMKRMSDELNATMGEVHIAAAGLAQASAEIASANQDLSARTEKTAANLQQTVASVGELTHSVERNAEASVEAESTASSATDVAVQGGDVVSRAVGTMHGISGASQKIADIIGVIDGIAFQTNILALNAAVEAARAGEQGKGFAVVATEVRMLAQRSAEAARQIKDLIVSSVEQTKDGADLVNAAGESMHGIVSSVQRVGELIRHITRASREQSDDIVQINRAIAELDQMTQQNAALVEESAAAAESLREQAQRLSSVVRRFKLSHERRVAQPA